MTDAQLILGIQSNNAIIWRYICRNLKSPFVATLKRFCVDSSLSTNDWEDIFQESCIILLENVKQGKFEERPGSSLFSYFVEIGKRTMQTALRKKSKHLPSPSKNEDTPHIIQLWPGLTPKSKEEGSEAVSTEDKQKEQDEFLDRVFNSLPSECQTLLKRFYWDRKPMDEIASTMGLRNADSAKTKKNRCMNKFKEIARMLLESDEFAEEAVRAAAELAALRELLADERAYCEMTDVAIAAYQVDEKDQEDPSSEEQESNE